MTGHKYDLIGNEYDDTADVPKDHNIVYRCTECGGIVPSVPRSSIGCRCGNVIIDKDYWRLDVANFKGFEVLRKVQAATRTG
jgi:hypothetical protein